MRLNLITNGAASFVQTVREGRYRLLTFWLIYLVAIFVYQGLFAWGFWERVVAASITASVLGLGAVRLHADYAAGLGYRARTSDEAEPWVVKMNDVEVGRISDREYAAMQLVVASDPRVYFAQAANVVRGCLGVFSSGFNAVPIGAFWILLVLAVGSPSTLADWLAAARALGPNELTSATKACASLCVVSMLASVAMCHLLGISSFGFVNCFKVAVGKRVRQRLGVTSDGTMLLTQWRFANPNGESDVLLDKARVLVRHNTVDS